jgi:hypothetical protein
MGTLLTTLSSVRLRIKDKYKNEFSDEEMLEIVVEVMEQVHEALRTMQSNLVIDTTTFSTVSGVSDYTTGLYDILDGSIWVHSAAPLELIMAPVEEADPAVPIGYMVLPSGDIRLVPTPDDVYTITLTSCTPFVAPTLATMNDYDFPWEGLWNRAILRIIVVECLTILERAIGVPAAQAAHAWDEAVMATYNRGIVRRTRKGRMFA